MKKMLTRNALIFAAVLVVSGLVFAAAINSTFPTRSGSAQVVLSNNYDTAQVDTLKFVREATIEGLAFGAYWNDSIEVNNIIMRRVIGGVMCPVLAGDTLVGAYASTAASVSRTFTVTLAPLADQYWFFVNYDSALGVAGTPTARYTINKQY